MRSVIVDKLGLDVDGDQAFLFLKEPETRRVLPIVIGISEAAAIAVQIQGQKAARPLTADLIMTILDTFDTKVLMAVINDMRDGVFMARIFLRGSAGATLSSATVEIDARPSDAIAIALRCNAPIYVAQWILDEAGTDEAAVVDVEDDDDTDDDDTLH